MKVIFGIILFAALAAPAYSVPQDQWLKGYSGSMPEYLCRNDYFSECFKQTKAECLSIAKKNVDECIERYKKDFPTQFDAESGGIWGAKIGSCAGARLDELSAPTKIHNRECDDPAFWIEKARRQTPNAKFN